MTTDRAIEDTIERIVRQFDPLRIILFGSHARGTANDASDIDLLVVVRHAPDRRKMAVEIRRTLRDMAVSKDIIVTTPDEITRRGNMVGSVLTPALREGKVVYEQP
jgi:predicted nucleotidyltransferase